MKVVFYRAPGKFREESLLRAIKTACKLAGDTIVEVLNNVETPEPGDVGIMVGMKASALRDKCVAAGQRVVVADKGYDRKDDWWRVSINAHQPTAYLMTMYRPADRMRDSGWKFKPWRRDGDGRFVLIAGGGAKYHSVWQMEGPAAWAGSTVRGVRAAGWRGEIQYRPKPSQPDKTVPADSVLSSPKYMSQALDGAHAMVTFGSNACFEAVLAGVPSVILGDAVLAPISSTSLADVCSPRLATDAEREQLLRALAYCQFRETEWKAGTAWPEIKRQLDEVGRCGGI